MVDSASNEAATVDAITSGGVANAGNGGSGEVLLAEVDDAVVDVTETRQGGASDGPVLSESDARQLAGRIDAAMTASTGDDAIDTALADVAAAARRSAASQIRAIEQAHAVLEDRLADVEE